MGGTHDNIPNSPPDILSILESKRTSSTARVETPGKVRMWVKPYSGWGFPWGSPQQDIKISLIRLLLFFTYCISFNSHLLDFNSHLLP